MKFKCERCGFACMAESLFVSHTNRCEKGISEREERMLIRRKQMEEDNRANK